MIIRKIRSQVMLPQLVIYLVIYGAILSSAYLQNVSNVTQPSSLTLENNYTVVQHNLAVPDIRLEGAPEVLRLLKCPESKITGRHNVSGNYFFQLGANEYTIVEFTEGEPQCAPDAMYLSKEPLISDSGRPDSHTLYLHGWLLKIHSKNPYEMESISPHRFCVMSLDDNDEFVVKYCRAKCASELCITKCCFVDQVCDLAYSEIECDCIPSGPKRWTSGFSHQPETDLRIITKKECVDHYHHAHYFTLNKSSTLNFTNKDEFKILPNGTVQLRDAHKKWLTLEQGSYCLDGAVGGDYEFSGDPSDTVLYMCRSISPPELKKYDCFKYWFLLPFATAFVILTLIVYVLTWSEQSIHGYTIFFYLVTLLGMFSFIWLGNMTEIATPLKRPTLCKFIAGGIHFTYLSTMCWLTSVSFNVWRTFKKMSNTNGNRSRTSERRRFIAFVTFSIGYPLVHVFACGLLDYIFGDMPEDQVSIVLPQYTKAVCNLSNNGITYYLYIPISILLLCNSAFFTATIFTMIQYKKSIREAFQGIPHTSCSLADHSFGIYVRLFIIMGLFWATQIVSWFVSMKYSQEERDSPQDLEVIFAIIDALTVLQAVAIFYIFVCRRNVFSNLWHLQPWMRPFLKFWITGGCCETPPPNFRKSSNNISSFKSRTLKSRTNSTENKRISKDSIMSTNPATPKHEGDEDSSRKISVATTTSNVTTTSTDGGLVNFVGRMSGELNNGFVKSGETPL